MNDSFEFGEVLTARGTVVQAGDVLLLTAPTSMTAEQLTKLRDDIGDVMPGLKAVFVLAGITSVTVADPSVLEVQP